ncbi:hypothetical protein EI94DRAFT_350044 [Lactarius quietus]|nr:hypothetical protein EI94DRAFT_350044 [Lactarius quietus]
MGSLEYKKGVRHVGSCLGGQDISHDGSQEIRRTREIRTNKLGFLLVLHGITKGRDQRTMKESCIGGVSWNGAGQGRGCGSKSERRTHMAVKSAYALDFAEKVKSVIRWVRSNKGMDYAAQTLPLRFTTSTHSERWRFGVVSARTWPDDPRRGSAVTVHPSVALVTVLSKLKRTSINV